MQSNIRKPIVGMALLFISGAAGQAPPRKRVAILNFDYSAVQSDSAGMFGANQDVGKGVADLLINGLVSGGQVSVIERRAIDKVLAEQNFSNSDRANPASAAKLGRILGVDAIVIGSITQFGRDDKASNIGGNIGGGVLGGLGARKGGMLGGLAGKYAMAGVGQHQAKAVVALNARLVSTDTGEILAVANGKGESTRSGTNLLGAGGQSIAASGEFDFASKNFSATILGEAVSQAVADLTSKLDHETQRITSKSVQIEGLVADVSGTGAVVLNVGSQAGVKVGDRMQVRRCSREIKDPLSGRIVRRVEDEVGEVVITDTDEHSSAGKFSGSMQPKVGDSVITVRQKNSWVDSGSGNLPSEL